MRRARDMFGLFRLRAIQSPPLWGFSRARPGGIMDEANANITRIRRRLWLAVNDKQSAWLRNPEALSKIDAPDILVAHHLVGGSRFYDDPIMQNISTIHDFECLADIVIGDQHTDSPRLEVLHEVPDIAHGNRVDTGKRLVQQNIAWA